jgi:hypothetical protein
MNRKIVSGLLVIGLIGGATACSSSEYDKRKQLQKNTTLKNSLEVNNLKEKLSRENNADAVRYVYLISFAQPIGYYIIKGKVSSSGSQLAPEQEVIKRHGDGFVLDSAQDDNTYGAGDPGIFFFLGDGTMVTSTLDYIESDAPLPIDVPRLGGVK